MIGGVFPVMIGDKDPTTGLYSNYFAAGCHPNSSPEVAVDSVEHKLREHLDREGLGLPYKEENTVKNIVTTVTANQGGFLQGDAKDAIPALVAAIVNMREVLREGASGAAAERRGSLEHKHKVVSAFKAAKDSLIKDLKQRELAELREQCSDKDKEIALLRKALESPLQGVSPQYLQLHEDASASFLDSSIPVRAKNYTSIPPRAKTYGESINTLMHDELEEMEVGSGVGGPRSTECGPT